MHAYLSHTHTHCLLTQAFDTQGTGLIINERLLNAPPKLGPPLVQFLMQEIKERSEEGESYTGPLTPSPVPTCVRKDVYCVCVCALATHSPKLGPPTPSGPAPDAGN